MRYRVQGDDGAEVIVDGFDWMTAMVHAIEQLGLEVSGWVCETRPDGSTRVLDAMSGRSWTVEAIGEGALPATGPQGRTVLPGAADADDLVAATVPPPTDGVAGAAAPSTDGVAGAAAPSTGGVVGAAAPSTGGVAGAAGPSTGGVAEPSSVAAGSDTGAVRAELPRSPQGLRPAGPPRGHSGERPERPKRRTLGDRPVRRPKGARSFPTAEMTVSPAPASPAPASHADQGPPADLAERLFDRSMDLAGAGSPDEACRLALELVLDLVSCEAGSVLRGGLNDETLTFVAVAGPAASDLLGQKLPFGHGIVGASFDLGIAIEVSDVGDDPRHASTFDERTGFRTRSVLCVPVQGHDVYHGALQLLNPLSGRFLPWHREVVEQVANSLASTLDGVGR